MAEKNNTNPIPSAVLLFGAILLVLLVGSCATLPASQETDKKQTGTQIGKYAPEFELEALDGSALKLSNFRGKPVILNFWASWCPPCREEMPLFERIYRENTGKIAILGVNLQESNKNIEPFVKKLGITFPILLDPEAEVKALYNVLTQPVTYFIDKDGKIIDKKFGPLTPEEFSEKAGKLLAQQNGVKTGGSSREVRILPDGTRYVIHPSKLESGGPPKDGIPSIDEPKIVSAREADAWLRGDELILGVNLFGTPRAYPFQILVWHELVNDVINGNPVLISYCPLCGTGIAFDRNVDGSLLSFGVSGKLYNSDLIMYDRKTDSYWMQLSGEAIIGEMAGARLKMLPADTVPWKEWKALHPDTGVLSKDTGHSRDYGSDPYGDYYKSRSVWFALEHEDARLHPKTVIYGIEAKGAYKAYTYDALIKEKKIKDDVGGVNVLIAMDDYGIVTVKNIETGEEIPKVRSFWFAWAATYPDTEVYSP